MTVKKILLFPDPLLSQPCAPIQNFDSSLTALIEDLFDSLAASPGVGLAAPQIGVPKQVSVIDLGRKKGGSSPRNSSSGQKLVLINPTLTHGSGVQIPREGCLSVPDLLANVKRFLDVTVQTRNERGELVQIKSSGFEALALQHEIDHLHGTLFLDRVANLRTDVFRRTKY